LSIPTILLLGKLYEIIDIVDGLRGVQVLKIVSRPATLRVIEWLRHAIEAMLQSIKNCIQFLTKLVCSTIDIRRAANPLTTDVDEQGSGRGGILSVFPVA
jgi:hypothetical protein